MAELGKAEEYTLNAPHPGYGKDKNIANEYGHTHYPKHVHVLDPKGKITSTLGIAKDAEEEAEMLKEAGIEVSPKPKGWNK